MKVIDKIEKYYYFSSYKLNKFENIVGDNDKIFFELISNFIIK